MYDELHRPQFHFTPRAHWMNDPNGLVHYKGEYHLFFQHSPGFVYHAPNSWGHAVSPDLVHWEQLEDALAPDEYGFVWSGSGLVDWNDTAGLKRGSEDTLVAVYTTGGFGDPATPCVQAIAFSNDRGRTFTRYEGNPVLGHVRARNRDPKVVRHEPTRRWIMALYLDGIDFALYASPDLKQWEFLSELRVEGTGECPDLFELPVDGDPDNRRWVFWGAAGVYLAGRFDGTRFVPETPPLVCEAGPNGYAAQTFSDVPPEDGRTIQMSWMRGGRYPGMPFNQQQSFPVELTLRTTAAGIRLFREPVGEIELLYERKLEWRALDLKPGMNRRALFVRYGPPWRERMADAHGNLIPDTRGDLFDIRASVVLGGATGFGVRIHGEELYCDAAGTIRFLDHEVAAPSGPEGRLDLRLLVDRTSLELFVNRGEVSASFCYLPGPRDCALEFYAVGGAVRFDELTVWELKSAWKETLP